MVLKKEEGRDRIQRGGKEIKLKRKVNRNKRKGKNGREGQEGK